MRQTNYEYMSDEARVGRVIHKLMDVTLRELLDAHLQNKRYINYVVEDVVQAEGLSEEKVQDVMSYAEFACLIDHAGGNSDYDFPDYDSYAEQMIYFRNIAYVLLNGSKASIPVRLFLAVPLKAFYGYMCKAAVQKGMTAKALQDDFLLIQKNCDDWRTCTIEDFLWQKIDAAKKPWLPISSLEAYRESVETAHKDMGRLLVGSFHKVFPEKFWIGEIHKKYRLYENWMEVSEYDELPFR